MEEGNNTLHPHYVYSCGARGEHSYKGDMVVAQVRNMVVVQEGNMVVVQEGNMVCGTRWEHGCGTRGEHGCGHIKGTWVWHKRETRLW